MFGNPYSLGPDSVIGGRRSRGVSGGLRDPLEGDDEAQRRRAEATFGLPVSSPAGSSQATTVADMLGNEPERPKGFWQGGKRFTGRDALASALAVLGDALARQNGSNGAGAVNNLVGTRLKGQSQYDEMIKDYVRNRMVSRLPGMSAREYAAYSADPKAWGGHMADALSTHHAAANVNPGDQRLFGNPNEGGSIYQAPTAAEQYAGALGETTGTPGYRTALQDYTLRGSGPTAYGFDTALDDHRTANDMSMEGLRQQNRIGFEGIKQGNRVGLRSIPTYRDKNPPAPRASAPRHKANPTATGKNGEKYEYNGSDWVRIR